MLWHLALLIWLAGIAPASAAPPLGCLENAAGARWCDSPDWLRPSGRPVQIIVDGPHPATIRRAPVPVSGHPAVVSALPVDALLPWRGVVVPGLSPEVIFLRKADSHIQVTGSKR